MAKVRVVRSPAAEEDLIEIWVTIALDNRAAADHFYEELETRIEQLATFPQSGPARPDIADGLRALSYRNYLILYRILTGGIDIVRVVHAARDMTALI